MKQYRLPERIKRGRFQIWLTTFLINILSLALPIMLLQIYDRIIPNQSLSTASLLITGVASAILIESSMRFSRAYLMAKIGARFEHEAGVAAFNQFLHADIEPFEAIGSGKNMERFNALGTVRDYFSGQAAQALYDLPFGFLFLGVIFYLGTWVVVVPVILIIGVFWMTLFYKENIERLEQAHVASNDNRFNFLIAAFTGLHSLKALGMEGLMLKRYEALQEIYNNNTKKLEIQTSRLTELGSVLTQASVVGVITIGSLLVIKGEASVGSLAACTLLTGRAVQLFLNGLNYWARLQQHSIAKQRFEEIFDISQEKIRTDSTQPLLTKPLTGEVTLRNVSFRFSSDTPYRLRHIDLVLHAKELIAITGGSGSGKSVLLELIRGTYIATEGVVLFDQERASHFDPVFLKKQIAYVSDEEPLFRGTIMENLTMFRPEKVEYALASTVLIGVDETIKGLPQGYQTIVGAAEDASLPLGLQQRIAIARVLVDQPRILLFDEANSSDDQVGDKNFQSLLECLRATHTVVIVTQRPSIFKRADRVYLLKDGYLTQQEDSDVSGS